jgi:hypothetical protein
VVYFEVLAANGNPELADVHWLIRSPEQEVLAQQMEAEGLPYADRVTRYGELARPGEVEVYHPGLTAGRVRRVRAGEDGWGALQATDIVLAEEIPDELPPCAAFLEPSAAALPEEVRAIPAPRDVLARAAAVERWSCGADEASVAYTNPRIEPDFGHDVVPFAAELVVDGVVTTHLDGLSVDGASVNGVDLSCAAETLWASPDELLLGWLDQG